MESFKPDAFVRCPECGRANVAHGAPCEAKHTGPTPEEKLKALEQLYDEVVELTIEHDIIYLDDGSTAAVVYLNNLAKALQKVDPFWWKPVPKGTR